MLSTSTPPPVSAALFSGGALAETDGPADGDDPVEPDPSDWRATKTVLLPM